MKGFFKKGNVHDATMIWNEMLKEGCKPNTVAYNTMIYGLRLNGMLLRAISIFYKIAKSEHLPNVKTYGILLNGFANAVSGRAGRRAGLGPDSQARFGPARPGPLGPINAKNSTMSSREATRQGNDIQETERVLEGEG
ncbi:Pentatricopeptide repeat-containing protein [Nymphaea thermarum]|nr:Pentatricopeptide repeat-containing protein [Nymphaea thermarum]